MNTRIALENVSKQYGGRFAVENVSLTLAAGECVGLAGHNGAGKSTLIKLILGLIEPTAGQISLLGEPVSLRTDAAVRRQTGYLPETVALHPALTGKETLDFYAKLKGLNTAANADLLARVGIAQAASRRVGTYSKGMRQRLALAQALLGKPQVLLFDEPTTGLDPASRQMFYQIVEELKAEGATVLLSTHALAELDGKADRIVVMKNGHKAADGTMAELQSQSRLPTTVTVRLNRPAELPAPWHFSDGLYTAQCPADEQTRLLHSLGNLDNLAHIRIHTPSLDEMYAELLKREDI